MEVKASTKDQLLDTAAELMTTTDTINITLSEIGKLSGLNTALVRYYFGNKRGLLFALASRGLNDSVADLRDLTKSTMSATDKMKRYIVLLTDFYYTHPYLNRLWPHLCKIDDEYSQKLVNEYITPIKEYMYSILDQGIEAGEFENVDKSFFAYQFMASCDALFRGPSITKKVFGVGRVDESRKNKYAQHLTAMLLGGLSAK